MDVPGAIRVLTVQGTTGVSLQGNSEEYLHELRISFHINLYFQVIRLTLQLASTPSPPAQIMLLVTRVPHQSLLEQVEWPTTGRRACCRMSAMGPPALEESRTLKFSHVFSCQLSQPDKSKVRKTYFKLKLQQTRD